jgi:hypothetical protein
MANIQITKHPNRKILINDMEIPDITDVSIFTDINGERVDTITLEIKIDKLELELI